MPALKLVKLHWRPVTSPSPSSLWSSLPPVALDTAALQAMFAIRPKASVAASAAPTRPKELLVLDPKRSNQINIGIRGLPEVGRMRELIERMDDQEISRAGVDKLQSLMPGEEEVAVIREAAREAGGEVPLGTAEQFLLMLEAIPGLECRLKLWAFKVDFAAMERDILEPLVALVSGLEAVRASTAFARLLATVLAVGNTLNRSGAAGFQLDYLAKLAWVKDTVGRASLLQHVVRLMEEQGGEAAGLEEELGALARVARTDYEQLAGSLANMEEECKTSLGFLTLSPHHHPDTRRLIQTFLTDAAERIMSMQRVLELVLAEFATFLAWLGLARHQHRDYPPARLAALLTDTARQVTAARQAIARERAKEDRRTALIKTKEGRKEKKEKKKGKEVVKVEGLEAALEAEAARLPVRRVRRSKREAMGDIMASTM